MRLAGTLLTPGEDWVLVFDADYQVMLIDDPALTRQLVANSDKNVITYTLLDGKDLMADEFMADYAQQRPIDTDWTVRDRAEQSAGTVRGRAQQPVQPVFSGPDGEHGSHHGGD
jgi:hypothetical protein